MNKILVAVLVTVGIIEVISLAAAAGETDQLAITGLVNLAGCIVCLLIGVILVIFKETREIGKGILIASGVVMVIGFSVCSASQFTVH